MGRKCLRTWHPRRLAARRRGRAPSPAALRQGRGAVSDVARLRWAQVVHVEIAAVQDADGQGEQAAVGLKFSTADV